MRRRYGVLDVLLMLLTRVNAPQQQLNQLQKLICDRTTRHGHCAELCLQINVRGGGVGVDLLKWGFINLWPYGVQDRGWWGVEGVHVGQCGTKTELILHVPQEEGKR